jgi:cytochrome oxidase Cu insertion factor (SCO1/SenC/PrrC family)
MTRAHITALAAIFLFTVLLFAWAHSQARSAPRDDLNISMGDPEGPEQ